jgi:hypothetical protein
MVKMPEYSCWWVHSSDRNSMYMQKHTTKEHTKLCTKNCITRPSMYVQQLRHT